jgi:glucose-6-phosphate isomerase
MSSADSRWNRYQQNLIRCREGRLDLWLDVSRMSHGDEWLAGMESRCVRALEDLARLEAGEPVNIDEGRMVGHYWLRDPDRAPHEALRREIREGVAAAKAFAARVHSGETAPPQSDRFRVLLCIGIGGSALGPQLVGDALADAPPLETWFLDNTDPDGMDRVLARIGPDRLAETLVVVTSKSGGTPETRNGMLEVRAAFARAGLEWGPQAVAITGPGSQLDRLAAEEGWLARFPMADWVGGRTSVMSVVGLVPAALQGVDVDSFLAGARAMDTGTRRADWRRNPALLLSLMWHHAGNGRGEKDMVVLPYKDRLVLFSKYLQQLVMESLGKEYEIGNQKRVCQGLAVYGNKGSTDQHAYVQQLRDGVNNFFAVFIEVRRDRPGASAVVDSGNGATSGDYLQGFLRGTRAALSGNGRESVTLSVPEVDAFHLGALIALFERAVTFYASLVNINAYHQPGVEAGKKAAGVFLDLMARVRDRLESAPDREIGAEEAAAALGADPEDVHHILVHLAANGGAKWIVAGELPGGDRFTAA